MDDTRKGIRLLIIISLALVVLETSTTLAMPLSDEKQGDRDLRSALESFLRDQPDNQTASGGNDTVNTTNQNQTGLSDDRIDDSDFDTSGSADSSDNGSDQDYFLKPDVDSGNSSSASISPTKDQTIFKSENTTTPPATNTTDFRRPVSVLSHEPVDNTDLSLEQPDLPNDENLVVKDVSSQNSSSRQTNATNTSIEQNSNSSRNSSYYDKYQSDGSGDVDDRTAHVLPSTKQDNVSMVIANNVSMPTNSSREHGRANETLTSKTKLFDFLNSSENYTKPGNETRDSGNTSMLHSPASGHLHFTLSNSSSSNSSAHLSKELTTRTNFTKQVALPAHLVGSYRGLGASPPMQHIDSPAVSPSPGIAKYPVNMLRLDTNSNQRAYPTGQPRIVYPMRAPNTNLIPGYSRQGSQWPAINPVQLTGANQPSLQAPNYQLGDTHRFVGRQGQSLGYGSNLYQRSQIAQPNVNTLLNSKGQTPVVEQQQFEDALLDSNDQQYQVHPTNQMDNVLEHSTVNSFKPNVQTRTGFSGQTPPGQNTRFYAGGQNGLISQGQPVAGRNQTKNMTESQAYSVYQAAIYLADLLKNESVKLDGMSSGQNALPDNIKDDDFLGDEESSERGSGDNMKLEEPENAVPSDVITDKEVEKLIQAQDLGQGDRQSPFSEGSGNSMSSLKDTSREEGSGVTLDNDKSTTQTDVKAQESLAVSDATQPEPQQQQQQPSQSVAPVVSTSSQQLAAPAVAAPVTTIPVDASSVAEQQFSDIAGQQFNDQSATSAAVTAQPSAIANTAAAQQFDATSAAQPPVQQYSDDTASSSQQAPQIATQDAYANQAAPTSNTEQLDENKFRALICQNGKDTISCPADKAINVVDANYGSMGASDCLGTQQASYASNEPTCKTPGAYEVVKTNCDDMQNCELTANDDIFGDECQSDKKYLDVTYNCDPSQCKSCDHCPWLNTKLQFKSSLSVGETIHMVMFFV